MCRNCCCCVWRKNRKTRQSGAVLKEWCSRRADRARCKSGPDASTHCEVHCRGRNRIHVRASASSSSETRRRCQATTGFSYNFQFAWSFVQPRPCQTPASWRVCRKMARAFCPSSANAGIRTRLGCSQRRWSGRADRNRTKFCRRAQSPWPSAQPGCGARRRPA